MARHLPSECVCALRCRATRPTAWIAGLHLAEPGVHGRLAETYVVGTDFFVQEVTVVLSSREVAGNDSVGLFVGQATLAEANSTSLL